MKLSTIKSIEELKDVINFLAIGFNWSLKKKEKIQKSLIYQNKQLKEYGYFVVDNNKILGGFLIFHQGNISYNKKIFKIINISSWYVLPKSRGGLPLLMIKNIIGHNHNSIITNFTPTVNTQKILVAFGFKKNNIYNLKINIVSLLIKYLLQIHKHKKLNILKNDLRRVRIRKNYFLNNLKQTDLKICKKDLSIIFAETYFEKDLKIFNLKLKGIRVLWTSNNELYSKHFFQINLFLLRQKKGYFCTTHCKLSNTFNNKNKDNNQLIFIPKDFDDKKLSSILSIGSELNFI